MTAVALLLALQMPSHIEAPQGDVGEVRRDFRGTKWVVVSGNHDTHKVLQGTIVFKEDNRVEIALDFSDGGNQFGIRQDRSYLHDPGTQVPVILPETWPGAGFPRTEGGKLRQKGSRLLLDLDVTQPCIRPWWPTGKVLLQLKQVK